MRARSADPFRDVVELASDRREALLACLDRGELSMTEPAFGEILAYGWVIRAALEAAGMMDRQVLPVPPGQIIVVARDEASLQLERVAGELNAIARPHSPRWQFWRRS